MLTEQEFHAATERYLDMVYRVALNAVKKPVDAEDVAQSVMLRLRQSVAEISKVERSCRRHHPFPRTAAVAVVLILALTGSALAAVGLPESIRGWFTHCWEEENGAAMTSEQISVIDSLTQPIGVSDTDHGITVTLDSILVGDSALWMLLKATGDFDLREEKTAYYFGPEELVFMNDPDHTDTPGGYGTDYPFAHLMEDGTLVMLMRYSIALTGEDTLLDGGEATLKLQDLMYFDEVLVEGRWNLPFEIESMDSQELLLIERAVVPARNHVEGGEATVEIRDIRVSSTGVRFHMAAEDTKWFPMLDGVLLTSGELCWYNGGGSRWLGEMENSDWGSDYYWEMPVDLTQVSALKFGDTLIPLQ